MYNDPLKQETARVQALRDEMFNPNTAPQRVRAIEAGLPTESAALAELYRDALPNHEAGAGIGAVAGALGLGLKNRNYRRKMQAPKLDRVKQDLKEAYALKEEAKTARKGAKKDTKAAALAEEALAEEKLAALHTKRKGLKTPWLNPKGNKLRLGAGGALGAIIGAISNKALADQITDHASMAAAREALGGYNNPL